jgi:F420-dependent methylenetetrahydromethanopterin dehydrogenase
LAVAGYEVIVAKLADEAREIRKVSDAVPRNPTSMIGMWEQRER